MRTIDSSGDSSSVWGRMRRDARTLVRIAGMTFAYLTVGARIRRAYRARQEAGETFWVDEPDR